MRLLLLTGLVGVLGMPLRLHAQAACNPAPKAAQLHTLQTALLAVKVEEMSTEVAVPLQRQIHAFKEAMADAVDAAVGCAAVDVDASALTTSIAGLLGANATGKPLAAGAGKGSSGGVYGADLMVKATAPQDFPGLRAIEIRFGIECGSDSMLLLYAAKGEGWRRILRWQSPEYAEISGAFGDFFQYAIVPGTGAESMHVAVAHGRPWCTSRFSGFGLDVLPVDAQSDAVPRTIWHTERGYSRGDFESRMRATANGFELRVNAPALDLEAYERTVIYRYRVDTAGVARVGPIATNGRGFVEEWLSMPWDEAAGQTEPKSIAGMKPVHDRLKQADADARTYVTYRYGPVRACVPKGMYEVEMDAEPGGREFYTIVERPDGYLMVNQATAQDERCNGPDLMKKR